MSTIIVLYYVLRRNSVKKNITLKLDEELIRAGKHRAIEHNKSLSSWVAGLIAEEIRKKGAYSASKEHALMVMEKGLDLGGAPLNRSESHERV
jgi:hypothetical protein